MANTHIADQLLHVTKVKHIAHKAVAFAHIEFAVLTGNDTGSILTTMLQNR
jgi:hypothetical protein